MSDGPIFLQGAAERISAAAVKIRWAGIITLAVIALFLLGCYIQVTVPVVWPVGSTLLALAAAGGVLWLLVRRPPCLQCSARAQLEAAQPAQHPTSPNRAGPAAPAARRGRITDADREQAIDHLAQAYVDGLIELAEHDRCVAMLLQATTYEELRALPAYALGDPR